MYFVTSNNQNILEVWKLQDKKISKLCSDNSYYQSVTSHDPKKFYLIFPTIH